MQLVSPKVLNRTHNVQRYIELLHIADPALCHLTVRLAIVKMVNCEIEEGIRRFDISKARGLAYYAAMRKFNDDLDKQRGDVGCIK